jgi:hypothetical protein
MIRGQLADLLPRWLRCGTPTAADALVIRSQALQQLQLDWPYGHIAARRPEPLDLVGELTPAGEAVASR